MELIIDGLKTIKDGDLYKIKFAVEKEIDFRERRNCDGTQDMSKFLRVWPGMDNGEIQKIQIIKDRVSFYITPNKRLETIDCKPPYSVSFTCYLHTYDLRVDLNCVLDREHDHEKVFMFTGRADTSMTARKESRTANELMEIPILRDICVNYVQIMHRLCSFEYSN